MSRLLYVTNGFPYPLTSGYLRHWYLLHELAAEHEITLLSLVGADHDPEFEQPVRRLVTHLEIFPTHRRARSGLVRLADVARAPLGGEPAARHLRAAAARLRATVGVDAAVVSGKQTTTVLRALAGVPVVADLCDATAARLLADLGRGGSPARRVRLARRALRTAMAERAMLVRADRCYAASARDAAQLARLHPRGHAPAVVPNGVDLERWRRTSDRRPTGTIVFAGRMGYEPNAEAALHLAREVLPRVHDEVPDARALIVGRDPTSAVRALHDGSTVIVTGEVADVRPYLDDATVAVAPLLSAAGIQNKVLEALAMEVPVVATPLAAAGLEIPDATSPVDVREGPAALAAGVIEHLRAAAAGADAPFAVGRDYVSRWFSWEASGRAVRAMVAEVLGESRAGSSSS
jgi:polysaccharide biosynthesis protein PslH